MSEEIYGVTVKLKMVVGSLLLWFVGTFETSVPKPSEGHLIVYCPTRQFWGVIK